MRPTSLARLFVVLLALAGGFASVSSRAAESPGDDDMLQRYRRAISFLPSQLRPLTHGLDFRAYWDADGNVLHYRDDSGGQVRWYAVDARNGARRQAEAPAPADASLATDGLLRSPNGRWALRLGENGNLLRVDLQSGRITALTRDGSEASPYAAIPDTDLRSLTRRLDGHPDQPVGLWSPDGTRLLSYRLLRADTYEMPVTVNVTPGAEHQLPWVHYQHVALPGHVPQRLQLVVFDLVRGRCTELRMPATAAGFSAGPVGGWYWSEDGKRVYAMVESDDFRRMAVYAADAGSGEARIVASDESVTGNTLRPDIALRFHPLGDGSVVLYSERDDRGHFYLYDSRDGRLLRQLTRGPWSVHALVRVDLAQRWLYFTAGGREPGHDPYYSHLYRVSLEGGEPQLLTPENVQHAIEFSPDGRWFVDSRSTIAQAPTTVLRRADGSEVAELARADIGRLQALSWKPPVRFTVKAADGRTDLYGVMYLPADLDEHALARYPIIDSQYSAPHALRTPRPFMLRDEMALAQLGFVVINVDGRATPLRTQSLQDLGFAGRQSEPLLVEDHKVAMEQLAERYPFIDIDRVGIYGHSAGGYRAARAMLQFPDFYKAGIASAGSHDPYVHESLARYYGRPQEFPDGFSHVATNMALVGNLKGHLLIAHGDIDEDVPLGVSLQLADALIRAGKDFDMFVYPNRNHRDLWDGYMTRKAWGYFVMHLLEAKPPAGIEVPDPD